jgi:hypothetical protein
MQRQRESIMSLGGIAVLLAGWVFLATPLLCAADLLTCPCECCPGDGGSHHGGCAHDPCSQSAIRANSGHRIPVSTALFIYYSPAPTLNSATAPIGRTLVSAFDSYLCDSRRADTPLLI